LADQAYARGENQRALVLVLAAATDFSIEMKEWAGAAEIEALDAALDRVKAAFLKVDVPVKSEPSVAGQMNLLDCSLETCPECGAPHWQWAPMTLDFGGEPRLQCGNCAAAFVVTFTQYNAIVAERKRTIGDSDRPVIRRTIARRERGAG
jgi:hypothetical protein